MESIDLDLCLSVPFNMKLSLQKKKNEYEIMVNNHHGMDTYFPNRIFVDVNIR